MASEPEKRRSLVYSRRHGHKLRPQRQALMRDLLPRVAIELPPGDSAIDLDALFSGAKKKPIGWRSASARASTSPGRRRATRISAFSAASPLSTASPRCSTGLRRTA
jgi:hypothetical protein